MRREAASVSLTCMPSSDFVPHVIVDVCTICRVDGDFSGDKTRRRHAVSRAGADPYDLACHYYCTPRDRRGLEFLLDHMSETHRPASAHTPRREKNSTCIAALLCSYSSLHGNGLLVPHRHTNSDRPYAYGCMIAFCYSGCPPNGCRETLRELEVTSNTVISS